MSKYNKYAEELNKAFINARIKFCNALNDYREANARYEESTKPNFTLDKEPYEVEYQRHCRKAEMLKKKEQLRSARTSEWDEFENAMEDITRRFLEDINEDNYVSPNELDEKAVYLIESGIMTLDEYKNFIDNFSDNVTMLRVIKKKLGDEAKLQNDDSLRQKYIMAYNSVPDHNEKIDRWNEIIQIARIYSGIARRGISIGSGGTDEYIESISANWLTKEAQAALDEF